MSFISLSLISLKIHKDYLNHKEHKEEVFFSFVPFVSFVVQNKITQPHQTVKRSSGPNCSTSVDAEQTDHTIYPPLQPPLS